MKRLLPVVALLTVLLSACTTFLDGKTLNAFPTNPEPVSGGDTALLRGQIVIEEKCLRLQSLEGDSLLIRWPYGYRYRTVNFGSVDILDANDELVASIDDFVELSGGEIQATPPPECEGPYWGAVSVSLIDSPAE